MAAPFRENELPRMSFPRPQRKKTPGSSGSQGGKGHPLLPGRLDAQIRCTALGSHGPKSAVFGSGRLTADWLSSTRAGTYVFARIWSSGFFVNSETFPIGLVFVAKSGYRQRALWKTYGIFSCSRRDFFTNAHGRRNVRSNSCPPDCLTSDGHFPPIPDGVRASLQCPRSAKENHHNENDTS